MNNLNIGSKNRQFELVLAVTGDMKSTKIQRKCLSDLFEMGIVGKYNGITIACLKLLHRDKC